MNIGTLEGYAALGEAGLNYAVLHEIGHLTAANRSYDAISANSQESVERMANDIGRAIANVQTLAFLPVTGQQAPAHGYSTTDPLVFTA